MMQIISTGMVSTHGRGMDALDAALKGRWKPPSSVEESGLPAPAYAVCADTLKDREILGRMRRADRLSKMATLAASDAWNEGALSGIAPERVGVLLATGLGPHVRTFGFLDGILDFGDNSVSPTDFSHSVHNAAAAYITAGLKTHGPVQTLTDFDFAFHQVLQLAGCWLDEKRCDAVLAGAADELGEVMLSVCSRMVNIPRNGRPAPLAFDDKPCIVPGEGAVFFLLMRPAAGASGPLIAVMPGASPGSDMTILDAFGMSGPESGYLEVARASALVSNYTPVFGSMMTGTAFHCAIAARMIEMGVCYAAPQSGAEHDIAVCETWSEAEMKGVNCVKRGRDATWRTVEVSAPHL